MMRPDHPFLQRGPDHPAAKLSHGAREAMRERAEAGVSKKELARQFRVHVETVYRVLRQA
jgi:DNA invertase Pin-like site-specific DNA recombinase